MSDIGARFARNLGYWRRVNGLSNSEFARRLGVAASATHKWQAGVTAPSCLRLPEICGVLECDYADLFEQNELADRAAKA